MRSLVSVESVTEKKIVKVKSISGFKGRLFYAIIPDKASKNVTFIILEQALLEVRVLKEVFLYSSVTFKLEPVFFCSSNFLAEGLMSSWGVKIVYL